LMEFFSVCFSHTRRPTDLRAIFSLISSIVIIVETWSERFSPNRCPFGYFETILMNQKSGKKEIPHFWILLHLLTVRVKKTNIRVISWILISSHLDTTSPSHSIAFIGCFFFFGFFSQKTYFGKRKDSKKKKKPPIHFPQP